MTSDFIPTIKKGLQGQIIELLQSKPGQFQHQIVEGCGRTRKTRSGVLSSLERLKIVGQIRQEGGLYYREVVEE